MKFLCDRCETRYSIADDRVRGKILKIRCKTCQHVITVREGMSADEPPRPARVKQVTTGAPLPHEERNERSVATERPREASVATQRPREHSGATERPRDSSAATQRPRDGGSARDGSVATQRPREGSVAAQRPREGSVATQRPRNETGSALNAAFASAMAKPPPALEEEWYVSIDGDQAGPFSLTEAQRWVAGKAFEAELHCWSEGFDDWLPVDKVSHFRGLRKKPAPLPRVGARSAPVPIASSPSAATKLAAKPAEDEPKALFASTMASLERAPASSPAIQLPAPAAPARATPPEGVTVRGNGVNGGAAARKPLGPFDHSEPAEPSTHIEAPAFVAPAAPPVDDDEPGEGDDLAIGEVSRVVNLADLARSRPAPRRAANPAQRATAANPALRATASNPALAATGASPALRATGASPALRGTGGVPALPAALDPGEPAAPEASAGTESAAFAPVAKHHRRGLIALLGAAIAMVVGAAVVVFVVLDPDDSTNASLGPVRDIDTSRPEDPITHRPLENPANPANPNPLVPRPPVHRPTQPTQPTREDPPLGPALSGDEVEDMARKHQDVTQRCYMRAQRGADSILIGDVKKITVTLAIARDGAVTDVTLNEHGGDNLGKCLIGSMKGWKFRPSAGGSFRLSLNFVGS